MGESPPHGAALQAGVRALRARDHSAASLDARLAQRGHAREERAAAVARLRELGYVDDARFALARAATLAARGAGDMLIADDLERHGIAGELVAEAIAGLEPERTRAGAIVSARGASPRTVRLLVSRGFTEGAVEDAVAATADERLG